MERQQGDSGVAAAQAIEIEALRRELERMHALEDRGGTLLAAILDHSPHGIIIADAKGALVLQNRAAERIWAGSATATDIAGWGKYRAFHPDGRPFVASDFAMAESLAEHTVIEARELHILRFDDTHAHLVASSAPLFARDGTLTGAITVFADVTRLKETEAEAARLREQLSAKSARLAVLARASEALASSLDARLALSELARVLVPFVADWCVIDELADNGDVRRLALAHHDPRRLEEARALRQRFPNSLDAPHGTARVLRSGRPEWVRDVPEANAHSQDPDRMLEALGIRSSVHIPLIGRGRVLGAFALATEGERSLSEDDYEFAQELARRASLALENARLYAAAEGSRARLEGLFTIAPAAISVLRGPEHRYELANAPYQRIMGGRALLGRTLREALPELAAQGVYQTFESVFNTGQPYAEKELEVVLDDELGKPQSARYFNVVHEATHDADGRIDGVASFAFEVTDQVIARRRLEQINRELDQFAYVASHDLKAPLRGIANLALWLEEDLAELATPDMRHKLDLLRGRTRRMEGLIDGILAFSRAGRTNFTRSEPVDTHRLARELSELLAPTLPARVTIAEGLPTLHTERVALEQVLLNLTGNALKHAGRADAVVHVSACERDGVWEFCVSDNGPGIAPIFHERIWGIFQTLAARDTAENTGIGLAIVKKLVETRGGRAWVESEEGQGARFRFTWPQSLQTRDDA